ncbi:MAG TPA: polysaccharide deacetylase family protein [Terriglobales bacterium]|nr:polysaccharide deacetylase family protein [Terriglobales bacterium]
MWLVRRFVLTLLVLSPRTSAQQRTVSITVDDLPYVSHTHTALTPADINSAREVNRKLLGAFKKHRVPVTGFVNEGRVQGLGPNAGAQILSQWIAEGLDLGNHTYSHSDINELSVPQIEDEILRGEPTVALLMKQAGKRLEFFRFPMNHTGDTKAKHDEIAVFLAQHGYKLATCTIDNSDYLFNDAYVRILDEKTAKKLRHEYLAYTSSEIDYYASLNKQVLGYEPPQVMLLHDNRLNADVINSLLELFVRKNYKFVSLATAQSDAAYSIPDTFITQYGWIWGYRWAVERGVKVNGTLEPEPPEWIVDYGKQR